MKHYKTQNDSNVYFSTCTIVQWQCLFIEQKYFQIITNSLNYCIKNKGLSIIAYVIMLNHLHLVTVNTKETVLSNIMRDFKRFTSIQIAGQLEKDNKKLLLHIFNKAVEGRAKSQQYKIWQDEFHPKAVYTPDFLTQKLEYIHNNPVRKGLVQEPEQWRYSSAQMLFMNEKNDVNINMNLLFED